MAPIDQPSGPMPRASTDPGALGGEPRPPNAGAPLEWLKEWSAALLIIATVVGGVIVIRDDIKARPTRYEVKEAIVERLADHSRVPHTGVSAGLADLKALEIRIVTLELKLATAQRELIELKMAKPKRR